MIWIFQKNCLKFLVEFEFFCGEKDFFNKKESLKIFQKIPNSKMFFIEKTGHQANLENPKLLAEKIKNFLF